MQLSPTHFIYKNTIFPSSSLDFILIKHINLAEFFSFMKLSVIFPVYNEEKGIADMLIRTKRVLESMNISFEILVVNDGSTDKTEEIAPNIRGVKVLSHQRNRGYGAALTTGFTAAKGEILCCLDADATYPPEEIPRLYKYLIEHDVEMVSGARLLGKCKGMPFVRKIGNYMLSSIATFLIGKRIYDLSSGMRVFKKSMLDDILPLSNDLDFTVRMTLKTAAKKIKFKELPIQYDEREGISKLSISRHGKMFLQSILYITRDYNPLRLFFPISFFFILIALINIIQLLIRRMLGEMSISLTNGLVITGMLGLFGLQILFFGVVADMIAALRNNQR